MNICIIDPIETVQATLSRVEAFKDPFLRFPLLEDISINAETDLKSWNDRIPGIGELINAAGDAEQVMSGVASITATELLTKLKAKTWSPDSAKPWEITVKIGFYSEVQSEKPLNTVSGLISGAISSGINSIKGGSKTDRQPGHWIHALNKLISYAIISFSGDKMVVPGCSVSDIKDIDLKVNQAEIKYKGALSSKIIGGISSRPDFNSSSKLVRVVIPGVIDLPIAVITSINTTYSKHNTDLGYPLWATADVTFMGILPAIAEDLVAGADIGKQMMGTTSFLGLLKQ